jgi:ribosomal protein RSM22 (predicted rRNA methylase)
VQDFSDALAYLALRVPATYAQILAAASAVQEVMPTWQPTSLLDIGAGPGTGTWAIRVLWPEITSITNIDQDRHLISLSQAIAQDTNIPIATSWKQRSVISGIGDSEGLYDIVLIANVLNELSTAQQEKLIGQAYNHCRGVLLLIEPGTPQGSTIISQAAKKLSHAGTLLAPYSNTTFISDDDYWLHFPQRFIRPEFQRRIRQRMRDSSDMASDWEEAKYSYVAVSKLPAEVIPWGRCVGPIKIQKGFLEVPILTQDGINVVKVLKRHKPQYTFAKNLRWGQIVQYEHEIAT